MKIATVVYKQCLASKGIRRKAWSFIRRALIKLLSDPICSLTIHGRCLMLPLSHSLPNYLKQFTFYDRLPQRISTYIHQKQGYLNCIDVGANIGDTIASFYKENTDTFLAIEPNPKFNKLLVENWAWNKNVTVVSDISCIPHPFVQNLLIM
ncbi:FkbM family methyltransferase [candidate division KSB1 bacterium]|nr:FkbM family methyltransferase [candidate division KSB1 bacterium]